MFAVVELGGKQYVVKTGDMIEVDRLQKSENETLEVSPLLVSDESGKTDVGTPTLAGRKVAFKVASHGRGEKVDVLRFKAKKHYWRHTGFRASLTTLQVTSVA